MNEPGSTNPIVFNNCITVKDAAFHSGYNIQYLRRMLRSGALGGLKIGQIWLIKMDALEDYINRVETTSDRRYGPKYFFCLDMYTNINTPCIRSYTPGLKGVSRYECYGY